MMAAWDSVSGTHLGVTRAAFTAGRVYTFSPRSSGCWVAQGQGSTDVRPGGNPILGLQKLPVYCVLT
jgi:hypothetical protein